MTRLFCFLLFGFIFYYCFYFIFHNSLFYYLFLLYFILYFYFYFYFSFFLLSFFSLFFLYFFCKFLYIINKIFVFRSYFNIIYINYTKIYKDKKYEKNLKIKTNVLIFKYYNILF